MGRLAAKSSLREQDCGMRCAAHCLHKGYCLKNLDAYSVREAVTHLTASTHRFRKLTVIVPATQCHFLESSKSYFW